MIVGGLAFVATLAFEVPFVKLETMLITGITLYTMLHKWYLN